MNKQEVAEINRQQKARNGTIKAPVDGSDKATDAPKEPKEKGPHKPITSPGKRPSFDWKLVGSWDIPAGRKVSASTYRSTQDYVLDHFFGDWYCNTALPIGVSFFAYLFSRLGFSFLWLIVVYLCAVSVYKAEFRRFNRDVRDDMLRVNSTNRLEDELETMEWMNSFLSKFWVIYMPALSDMVLFNANEVMKDQAPGFGIEAIALDEFTLGSKAPRIDSIQSFTRKGRDHIEMVWSFSFTPNDTDGMTKNEMRKKISPKVALGVTVGKAFILKSFPILVEDMSCTGRLNIKLKLNENFPHVKTVSVQFLEPPVFDYALKPVGGDSFGLDIMSFIPGLSSFVNGLIHSNLRPFLYAPNSLDIDVEEIMSQQSNDSVGVLYVHIKRITNLKSTSDIKEFNPYVQLSVSNNQSLCEKTKVKKNTTDPVYLETKYLLISALDQNHLTFNVFHMVPDKMLDTPLGIVKVPLIDFLQKEVQTGLTSKIIESGKVVGKLEYDLKWYPTIPDAILEDGTKEHNIDTQVGIMKLSLFGATDLDTSKSIIGLLDPYAEVYVNNELIKTSRRLKKTNEPAFGVTFESLITLQAQTSIQVIVKDSAENQIVGRLDANLQDLVFESSRGQQWITAPPVNKDGHPARFRIGAKWKALPLETDEINAHIEAPIGGLRLHIRMAKDLINLEAVGDVDPYVKIIQSGRLRAKTNIIAETLNPYFNQVFFLPVANEHQHVLLDIFDAEPEGKDRPLGSCAISIKDFLKKSPDGYYLGYDGEQEVIEQPVLYQGKSYGTMSYSVSFFPNIPVMTKAQIENIGDIEAEQKKKEQAEKSKELKEKELYEKYPNDYEWVEMQEDICPEPTKIEMPLEKAIKYRSGTLLVKILSGSFNKPDYYVHTLFDDNIYPAGVSAQADGRNLTIPVSVEAFMRDLPNSKVVFRLSKRRELDDQKDVATEKILQTLDVLKRSFAKPLTINLDAKNKIKVRMEFIPSAVKLPPLDTVLDVGLVTLDILSASGLKPVDRNGKSDPFCVIKLDGIEIHRTDKQRRTLNPVWNDAIKFPMLSRSRQVLLLEVYDWDLTHDDELLGLANLDLSLITPNNSTQFELQLDTEGTMLIRATFKPQFVRPKLSKSSGLPIDLSDVTGVPLKVVGGAADLAGNAVGSGIALVTDGVSLGGNFIKGVTKGKKKSDLSSIAEKDKERKPRGSKDFFRRHKHDSTSAHGHDNALENLAASSTHASGDAADDTTFMSHTMDDIESRDEDERDESDEESTKHETAPSAEEQQNQNVPSQVKNAIPNILPEFIPPPQGPQGFMGHLRNISDSTNISTISAMSHGERDVPGRISIVSLKGLDSAAYSVKATLKKDGRSKDIFKTKSVKPSKSGEVEFKEHFVFLAPTNGMLIFHIREHHALGRKQKVALVDINLSQFVGDDKLFNVAAGKGELLLKITYGAHEHHA